MARRAVFICIAAAMLAGCYGSVFVAVGDDGRRPPLVSLSASQTRFAAPGTLTLAASTTSDRPIVEVRFFQIVGGTRVPLDTRTALPYATSVAIDASLNGTLSFVATALDQRSATGESAVVDVDVAIAKP